MIIVFEMSKFRGLFCTGQTCRNESAEQRMRRVRFREELRMILAGQEPGVISQVDQLDQAAIRGGPGNHESALFHVLFVLEVEFVPVTVSFDDLSSAVGFFSEGSRQDICRPASK